MRSMHRMILSAAALAVMSVGSASATTYFQDNVEGQAIGNNVGAPQIGTWTEGAGSGLHGADIVGAPAIGTRSIRAVRDTAPPVGPGNVDLKGLSLPGAMVAGQTVEVKWSHFFEGEFPGQYFNGPMQVAIGAVGSNFNNDLAFVQIADGNTGGPGDGITSFPFGNYAYYSGPAQFGVFHQSLIRASLNPLGATTGTWDTLRAVMSLVQLDATHIGGTMDLYLTQGAGAEVALATGATLQTIDTSLSSDPTSMQIRFVKGPASGISYYDDISINSVAVPEPASLGLAALGLTMLVRRSRK